MKITIENTNLIKQEDIIYNLDEIMQIFKKNQEEIRIKEKKEANKENLEYKDENQDKIFNKLSKLY